VVWYPTGFPPVPIRSRAHPRPTWRVRGPGRDAGCVLTDDVIAIDVLDPRIDLQFLAVQLRSATAAGGYLYEAKLFTGRVKELEIELPALE